MLILEFSFENPGKLSEQQLPEDDMECNKKYQLRKTSLLLEAYYVNF